MGVFFLFFQANLLREHTSEQSLSVTSRSHCVFLNRGRCTYEHMCVKRSSIFAKYRIFVRFPHAVLTKQ